MIRFFLEICFIPTSSVFWSRTGWPYWREITADSECLLATLAGLFGPIIPWRKNVEKFGSPNCPKMSFLNTLGFILDLFMKLFQETFFNTRAIRPFFRCRTRHEMGMIRLKPPQKWPQQRPKLHPPKFVEYATETQLDFILALCLARAAR